MIKKLKHWYAISSRKRFRRYLEKKGVKMGKNVYFKNRKTVDIDLTRPLLIEIGNNVYFNRDFTLLTHDAVSRVFRLKYNDFFPHSYGKVKIGNNVSFARKVTVLKGVTIGDNVFIGHGSIVAKDIPSNCIAVGRPAKPVCSLDEYLERTQKKYTDAIIEYYNIIKERENRIPTVDDFWDEFELFVDGDKLEEFMNTLSKKQQKKTKKQMGKTYDLYKKNHKAMFKSFDDMIYKLGLLT